MNLKKIVILPAAFIIVHILYISCCGNRKCPEGDVYRDVVSLRTNEYSVVNFFSRDSVKVEDTLFVSLNIGYKFIAQQKVNIFEPFVNQSMALSCPDCTDYNDLGYKFPIDSLTIRSNRFFKGVNAGVDISNFFSGVYYRNNNGVVDKLVMPIPQLLDSLNNDKSYEGIALFTDPGIQNEEHRFTYTIYSNNKIFSITSTRLIIWE